MAARFVPVPPNLADDHPASRINGTNNTTSITARIKRLPPGTKATKLVGEGAANAVFEIKLPNSQACPEFDGLLLRVAKVPRLGLAPTYDYVEQLAYLDGYIRPRLGNYVASQELVDLQGSDIIEQVNQMLEKAENSRKEKFKGSYVGESLWGFLVQDMRPQDPSTCTLVEFKPKWLSQSPSAPMNAIRCRQCAMELRNLLRDPSWGRARPERKPCPLALLSDSASSKVGSPFRLAPQLQGRGNDERYRKALLRVSKHPAIRELKVQQDRLDEVGPLYAKPGNDDFVLAMTLRDCTCFCQIDNSGELVAMRFSDFDWKDPAVKLESWRSAEKDLIDSGFYTAEWLYCGKSLYRPPTLCLLEQDTGSQEKIQGVIHVQDRSSSGTSEDTAFGWLSNGTAVYSYASDLTNLERILRPYHAQGPGT